MTEDTRRNLDAELNSLIAQAEAMRHVHFGDFDTELITDYARAMRDSAQRASSLVERLWPT